MRLNGVETAAYIDSGSNVTLIRKSFAENISGCSDCGKQNVNAIRAKEDLSETGETKLQIILRNHSDCFAESISELGKSHLAKLEIQLTTDKPDRIASPFPNVILLAK